MKKLFQILAMSALFSTTALAEEQSVVVQVPETLETAADFEAADAALTAAAQQLCDNMEYVGLSAFYKNSLRSQCVAEVYAENAAKFGDGRLAAYKAGKLEKVIEIAAN